MTILLMIVAFAAFATFIACQIWRSASLAIMSLGRLISGALMAIVAFVLPVMPAAAQVSPAAGIVATVTPLLIDLLAIVLMAALTWAAAWGKRKFGIDIESRHRDALHSALMTGARLAAARQLTGPGALQLIMDYVRKSVPDALATLDPSQAVLTDLADAKLQEALGAKVRGLNQLIKATREIAQRNG